MGELDLPHRVGLVCYLLGRQIGLVSAQIVRGALSWLGWELRRGPASELNKIIWEVSCVRLNEHHLFSGLNLS